MEKYIEAIVEEVPFEDMTSWPEVGEAEVAEVDDAEKLQRRTILKHGLQVAALGGLAAVSGVGSAAELLVADTEITHSFEQEHVSIDLVDRSAEALLPHEGTLIVPGFNVGQPRQTIAEPLKDVLKNYGRLWCADYGQEPFDSDAFSDKVVEHCHDEDITSLSLVGHSMGGMITVALAAKLAEAGIHVPVVYVISTPAEGQDVIGWSDTISEGWPEFLCEYRLSGGYMTRTGINYVQDLKQRFRQFRDDIQGPPVIGNHQGLNSGVALRDVRKVSPGQLWQKDFDGMGEPAFHKAWEKATSAHELNNEQDLSQLVFIGTNPICDYADKIPTSTAVIYIGAMDPKKDSTVNVTTAEPKFRYAFDRDGRMYLHMRDPDIGHADPGAHPRIYSQLLDQGNKWCGLPDVRNIPQVPRHIRPGIYGPR